MRVPASHVIVANTARGRRAVSSQDGCAVFARAAARYNRAANWGYAMLNRRQLLASTAALAPLVLLKPAFGAEPASGEAARLNVLFDAFFQEGLRQNPENATQIGLDTGANADLRGKLRDESRAGVAAAKALNADQIK